MPMSSSCFAVSALILAVWGVIVGFRGDAVLMILRQAFFCSSVSWRFGCPRREGLRAHMLQLGYVLQVQQWGSVLRLRAVIFSSSVIEFPPKFFDGLVEPIGHDEEYHGEEEIQSRDHDVRYLPSGVSQDDDQVGGEDCWDDKDDVSDAFGEVDVVQGVNCCVVVHFGFNLSFFWGVCSLLWFRQNLLL